MTGAHWALAIHGGAGGRASDTRQHEVTAIRETLIRALEAGAQLLAAGESAVQAAQAAVKVMEASGVLNAGRGAVLNHEGYAELDAAIMDGKNRAAGAVACVRHVPYPIDLARKVMDASPHVLLVGTGAEQFAHEQWFELGPPEYFLTEQGELEHERALAKQSQTLGLGSLPASSLGTVGAVALDANNNLAAATSTGGLTNKHAGRVGDSALIGAGTYAENGLCAVSTTGRGEYFIRCVSANDLRARMKYRNEHLQDAARNVIEDVKGMGGHGGLIAINQRGDIAMPYSTPTMLRGMVTARDRLQVFMD